MDDPNPTTKCRESPLLWVLFLVPFILLTSSWWVLEIPLLFMDNPHGNADDPRWRRFFRAVSWNCARLLQPTYVAATVLNRSRDEAAWKVLYYFGYEPDDDGSRALTWWECIRIVAVDGMLFATEIWLVVQNSHLPDHRRVPFGLGSWLLQTAPACVNGAWFIAAAYIPGRLQRVLHAAILAGLLVAVGLGLIIASYITTPGPSDVRTAGIVVMVLAYASSMLPLCFMSCCGAGLYLIFYGYSAIARCMLLVLAVTDPGPDAMLCFVDSKVSFLVPLIITGTVFVFILGFSGGRHSVDRHRKGLFTVQASELAYPTEDHLPLQSDTSATEYQTPLQSDRGATGATGATGYYAYWRSSTSTARHTNQQASTSHHQDTELQPLAEDPDEPPPLYKRHGTIVLEQGLPPSYEEELPLGEQRSNNSTRES